MKIITPQLRERLAQPLAPIAQSIPEGRKAWACVGDYSCIKLLEKGIEVKIVVYDLKTKRQDVSSEEKSVLEGLEREKIECVNPPGMITESLEKAVEKAVKSREEVKIYVDGEEDLAVLPLIIKAPFNALIAYGQPDQGMVLVECSVNVKQMAKEFLEKFEEEE